MRTNTDIEGIKRVAKLLLEMPVEVDKKFEFICHHPFIKDTYTPVPCEKTESNPAGMEMLDVRDQDDLERIKSFYIKGIDNCKKALDFFIVINKPYSGIFFKLIKDLLNRKDYTDMLETLWTMMEYPNKDINVTQKEWVSYWKKADLDYLYSFEDKKKLDSLPDEFYVYRGLMERADLKALSWTLSLDKAIWFATRWNNKGKVYRGLCKKEDILAYLSCRNEEEIVVDWHDLENIEEVMYEKN